MEKEELLELAEEAIDEYFSGIGDIVDKIVESIIDKYGLDDDDVSEDNKKFLKERIMRSILKLDEENVKYGNND